MFAVSSNAYGIIVIIICNRCNRCRLVQFWRSPAGDRRRAGRYGSLRRDGERLWKIASRKRMVGRWTGKSVAISRNRSFSGAKNTAGRRYLLSIIDVFITPPRIVRRRQQRLPSKFPGLGVGNKRIGRACDRS